MLSSPFRSPPPDEAALDRLHRVFAPPPPDVSPPAAWPTDPDAPFLSLFPEHVRSAGPANQFPEHMRPADPVDRSPEHMRPADPADRVPARVWPALPADRLPSDDFPGGLSRPDLALRRLPEAAPEPGRVRAGAKHRWDPARAGAEAAGSGEDNAASPLPGRAAFDPGRRGLRALAAVAALVVAIAAYLAWQARPTAEPAPEPEPAVVSGAPRPSVPASPVSLVVAVTGRVRKPGLVWLPPGSRVADAIEAAGGVLPDTDLSTVNLARKVTDGELVAVAVPGLPAAGAPDAGGGGAAAGPVNLNTATLGQLDALPGVGPVLAQRILDHRARHGAFRGVGDLRQVEGIGDAKFAQLKDLVTV